AGDHVAGADGLAALRAGERGHGRLPAGAVHELDRWAVATGHPAVAPACERHDHRIEVASLLGQSVLEARRVVLVADAIQDAVRDELAESVGQPVAGSAEVALEILEATDAEERVAQDEERPAVAHDRQRPGDGAGEAADVTPAHGYVPFRNPLRRAWRRVNIGAPTPGAPKIRAPTWSSLRYELPHLELLNGVQGRAAFGRHLRHADLCPRSRGGALARPSRRLRSPARGGDAVRELAPRLPTGGSRRPLSEGCPPRAQRAALGMDRGRSIRLRGRLRGLARAADRRCDRSGPARARGR